MGLNISVAAANELTGTDEASCTMTWSPAGGDNALHRATGEAFQQWTDWADEQDISLNFIETPEPELSSLPRIKSRGAPYEVKKDHVTVSFATDEDPTEFQETELGVGGLVFIRDGGPFNLLHNKYRFASLNIENIADSPGSLKITLLHEIGHALGVAQHNDDPASVMHHELAGQSDFNDADKHTLEDLFGHCAR